MVGATAEEAGFSTEITQAGQRALRAVHSATRYARSSAFAVGRTARQAQSRASDDWSLNEHPRVFIATGHYKDNDGAAYGSGYHALDIEGQPGRDMQPFVPSDECSWVYKVRCV